MLSPKVSAVLITRRLQLPPKVALALQRFPFDEVIVETECKGVHRRFELAARARNEIIYVQDDDAVIDIEALWRRFDGRTTYAITEYHKGAYDALCGSRVFLLGWGCFFHRVFADPALWRPYVERFGPVPSIEADRVFTFFAGESNPVVMPIEQHQHERAMSRDNPNHYVSRDKIIKQLLEIK